MNTTKKVSFWVQKATKSIEKGPILTLLGIAVVSAGPPFPGHINVVVSRGDPSQNKPNFDLVGEGWAENTKLFALRVSFSNRGLSYENEEILQNMHRLKQARVVCGRSVRYGESWVGEVPK